MKLPNRETVDGYRSRCLNENKAEDCHLLAEYLRFKENDLKKAITLFKVNCDEYGYAESCLEYGNFAFSGIKSKNVKSDPTEALRYFEKGCNLGSADNCLNSGLLLVSPMLESSTIPRDLPKGFDYLKKSCELNNGNACFYLSGMFMVGVDNSKAFKDTSKENQAKPKNQFVLEKDVAKAFSLTARACGLKSWMACSNLSQMYADGNGTEKNPEKSEHYKRVVRDLREEQKREEILSRFRHP